jgi:hypothetical protein
MAYLLHYGRDRLGGGTDPVGQDRFFADVSSVTDYSSIADRPSVTTRTKWSSRCR